MQKVKKGSNIIIASDSFKGCLTSHEVGQACADGIERLGRGLQTKIIGISDGGEGFLECMKYAVGCDIVEINTFDPLGREIKACYGIKDNTAIIETAQTSGLGLLGNNKNPLKSTTYGMGILIKDAVGRGCKRIIVGLGGSATNDGGMGMLRALGIRFLDSKGRELYGVGSDLFLVKSVNTDYLLDEIKEIEFILATDVENPLLGEFGATRVFAPQKGADCSVVEQLEAGMANYASVCKMALGKDFSSYAGTGAAGGLGYAFVAFLGARICSGIDFMLDACHFSSLLKHAALVITGEGRVDCQTAKGKAPFGVLRAAKSAGVPVVAIGGSIERNAVAELMDLGFAALFSVSPGPEKIEDAVKPSRAKENISIVAAQIVSLFLAAENSCC